MNEASTGMKGAQFAGCISPTETHRLSKSNKRILWCKSLTASMWDGSNKGCPRSSTKSIIGPDRKACRIRTPDGRHCASTDVCITGTWKTGSGLIPDGSRRDMGVSTKGFGQPYSHYAHNVMLTIQTLRRKYPQDAGVKFLQRWIGTSGEIYGWTYLLDFRKIVVCQKSKEGVKKCSTAKHTSLVAAIPSSMHMFGYVRDCKRKRTGKQWSGHIHNFFGTGKKLKCIYQWGKAFPSFPVPTGRGYLTPAMVGDKFSKYPTLLKEARRLLRTNVEWMTSAW